MHEDDRRKYQRCGLDDAFNCCFIWAAVAFIIIGPIICGCYFGIYAPILDAGYKDSTRCTVLSVDTYRIGAKAVSGESDDGATDALRCLDENTSPYHVAQMSYYDENGILRTDGVACATRISRQLTSWAWGIYCGDISRGSGYQYQRFHTRPSAWECSECEDCTDFFTVGKEFTECQVGSGRGSKPYVLVDQPDGPWVSWSEYYAMTVFGFGMCFLPPWLFLTWFILMSKALIGGCLVRNRFPRPAQAAARRAAFNVELERVGPRQTPSPPRRASLPEPPRAPTHTMGRRNSSNSTLSMTSLGGPEAPVPPAPPVAAAASTAAFDDAVGRLRSAINSNQVTFALLEMQTGLETGMVFPPDAREQLISAGKFIRESNPGIWTGTTPRTYGKLLQGVASRGQTQVV